MNILAIDTSTNVLGIALINHEKIIGEYVSNIKRTHSVRVLAAINELLNDCQILPSDIGKIVVAEGPGSYTGLRIGVTIAKTLAWSLNIPLVGVSSLKILAQSGGKNFAGLISPMMDARRGYIYTGLYKWSDHGELEEIIADQHIHAETWANQLKEYQEKVLFLGYDVKLHKQLFIDQLAEQAVFGDIVQHLPRPTELALLGLNRPGEDIHTFIPKYLRLAEAEAKWKEEKGY